MFMNVGRDLAYLKELKRVKVFPNILGNYKKNKKLMIMN